ncbi:hypothetical protein V8B97DRAFT_1920080, partial [Scleroderma yunnanense]
MSPESGNIVFVKKPSKEMLGAISKRAASMGNVYKAMKLSPSEGRLLFKQVKDIMIHSTINFDEPFSMQKKSDLNKLKRQICKNIPYFSRYEGHWPVHVIMERHFYYNRRLATNQTVIQHLTEHKPKTDSKSKPDLKAKSNSKLLETVLEPPAWDSGADSNSSSLQEPAFESDPEPESNSKPDLKLDLKLTLGQCHGTLRSLLVSTNTIHHMFSLTQAGLTDDQEFQTFLNSPSHIQESFVSGCLQGRATP